MSDDEAGFLIDGKRYELPDMGTFTIRESRVFYKETGLVPEVVRMRLADGSLTYMDLLENIGFLPALAMIAYSRDNEADDVEIERVIGNTARDDLFMALLDQPDEEPDPPPVESTKPPPELSQNGSSESTPTTESSSSTSGSPSTPSSDRPDAPSDSTGTIGSDTSPTSAPARLVT